MGTEDNGLTLEGLAQRLEALQRENAERLQTLESENERMRSENTELRDEVTALRGSDTRRNEIAELREADSRRGWDANSEFAGPVSRRSVLSKAGAAAVAAVAAGTLLGTRQAKADHYDGGITVNYVQTHHLRAEAPFVGLEAVEAYNTAGDKGAVHARNAGAGPGVRALGGTGVWGSSEAAGFSGVYGQHTGQGYGVVGDGKGANNAGVLGRNNTGDGIRGEGKVGVFGKSSTGTAPGVLGESTGGGMAGVFGRNVNGCGGTFTGGRAQARLYAGINAGKPTGAHSQGEVYMDKAANLFVCTVTGNPGTWRRVQTVAVTT